MGRESTAGPMQVSAELYFTKFRIAGRPGDKVAVFIPHDKPMDAKLVRQLLTPLGLPAPNLVINPIAACYHPRRLLTDKELMSGPIQTLATQHGMRDKNEEIRTIVQNRVNSVVGAVMASAEQTGSWSMAVAGCTTFEICLSTSISSGVSSNAITIGSIALDDDRCCASERSKKLAVALFDRRIPADAEKFKAMETQEIPEAAFLGKVTMPPEVFNGNCFCDEQWEYDTAKRHPWGDWCWPDAYLHFLSYKLNDKGELVFGTERGSNYFLGPLGDTSALAPSASVSVGGKSMWSKGLFMQALGAAQPMTIINHTGGLSNLFSEMLLAVIAVMNNNEKVFQKVSHEKFHSEQLMKKSIKEKLSMISAHALKEHAMEASAFDEKDWDPNALLTIPDVVQFLDHVKLRPQVFTETIRVVDPITQSAEECLEVLSSCLSSTYTGVLELGAGDAQREAVAEAWRLYLILEEKATITYAKFELLSHLAAFLAWLAILLAVVKEELDERLINTQLIGVAVIALPIISGLITGVITTFSHRDKWAKTKWATAEIIKLIYFFRGEVGTYGAQVLEENSETADDSKMSLAARKRESRKHFVKKVTTINSHVMTALQEDSWALQTGVVDAIPMQMMPTEVFASLYGHRTTRADSENCFEQCCAAIRDCTGPNRCCCPRRNRITARVNPQNTSDLEAPLLDTSMMEAGDDNDDCVSPMSAEMYFHARVVPLMKKLAEQSPELSFCHNTLTISVMFCSFFASILGAFHGSKWIPVALGFAAMLSAFVHIHRANTRLSATNAALAGLRSLEVQYRSSSTMDRRTPAFKQALILRTEQLAMGVTMAWVGAAVALTEGGDDGAENSGKAAEKQDSTTKKQNPTAN